MRWPAFVVAVLLAGCQAIQALDDMRTPNETAFANMWSHYTHCRSGTDVIQMWRDAQHLNRTVRLMDHAARAAQLLPDTIEQILAEPPPRLSVDPKAMAAACTVLAAHAAQNTGRPQFAAAMFSFVLTNFAQPRYAYYQQQARMGLDQMAGNATERVVLMFDRLPHESR